MEEFSALAARVAVSVGDLRGVLILSRDGLVLGAFPDGDEALVKPAWLRFAGLGEPDKGFVEFGDELWAYVRRGPYASFAVTGAKVRPGLVMDQLEQMLLAAEEIRARREALRLPDAAPAPSGRPRTSLHAESKPTPQPAPAEAPARLAGARPPQAPAAPARPGGTGAPAPGGIAPPPAAPRPAARRPVTEPPAAIDVPVSGPPSEPSPAPGPDGGPERSDAADADRVAEPGATLESDGTEPERREPTPPDDDAEVDPVLLAQEFSRLLQEAGGADET